MNRTVLKLSAICFYTSFLAMLSLPRIVLDILSKNGYYLVTVSEALRYDQAGWNTSFYGLLLVAIVSGLVMCREVLKVPLYYRR